jgi:Tfp pilus assembly protein PilO
LLKKTIDDFEKIKPEKEKLEKAFVVEGKELDLITILEKISDSHGLSQELSLQKNPNVEESRNFYYHLPLEVNLSGDFVNILKYFEDLEKINYYFNISTISIRNNDGVITMKLIGEIYIKKPTLEEKTI